ncbi:MAG: potassium transporter TrkG [Euryarchaeota archaeon]|nr:potassium transporter TrkG [Euryarchaeota archaeon]
MVLGAVSFPLYYISVKKGIGNFFKDTQVQALLLLLLGGTVIFSLSFGPDPHSVVSGMFQTTTSITTTGFNTVPTASLSDADKFVTTILMVIGGSTGSTAGGIKIFRLLILFGFVRVVFFRSILPKEAKIPLGFRNIKIKKEEAEFVAAFFVIYLVILALSTVTILWIEGSTLTDTLFEVASAEGTVGMSVGLTSSNLSFWSKLVLIFNMWIGRLEIFPVLVVFHPGVWVKKWRVVIRKEKDTL